MKDTRKKIIFVDDINHSLITVKDGLKEYYEIYPALSAARMFEILDRVMPDLILLDINMPDVNGFETIQRLKADSRYADIPVIFLTSRNDKESVSRGFKLGAADYVCKPLSVSVLIERIECQLNPDTRRKSRDAECSRKRVFYVDDVNYSLVSVKSRLKDYYEVYPIQSGELLFETLKRVIPDLILLDINMPGIDGYEIIRRLKASTEHAGIPIIFLTSQSSKEDVLIGFSLGAADYVSKPFVDSDLIERIEYQLNSQPRDFPQPVEDDDVDGRPRVLVVDNTFYTLNAVHSALNDDYRLYMQPNLEKVSEFLQHTAPDMFLLSYDTLLSDGFDLMQIIRKFPKHRDTPIITIMPEGVTGQLSAVGYVGACGSIVKPFKPEKLRKKVAEHIKTKDVKTEKAESEGA